MKSRIASILLFLSIVGLGAALSAQSAPAPAPVPLGEANVYISPMNGFEIYLAAAFREKKVPMHVVTDKAQADYVLNGVSASQKAGWAKMLFKGETGSAETASVQLVDKAGNVVWAYSVNKGNSVHGEQSTAEACAKHLKGEIEKREKERRKTSGN